jgi:hypothetical protein
VLRFATDIQQFGHAGLHTKCHLVLRNPSLDFRISDRFKMLLIQCTQTIECAASNLSRDPGRIAEKQDCIALVSKLHALML